MSSTPFPIAEQRREGALGPYLRAIRAHRVVVVAITLLTFAAATAFALQRTRSYTAQAEILVTPLPQNDQNFLGVGMLRDSGDPTRTVQTAATLIETPDAALLTANRLADGTSRGQVSSAVHVQPVGQSNILGVSATAHSAERAALLANTYATSALQLRNQSLKRQINAAISQLRRNPASPDRSRLAALESVSKGIDPTLGISLHALAPRSPDGSPTWAIAAIALIAGFIIASIVALLLERLDHRLSDEDELLAAYPLPVLASVPLLPRRLLKGPDAQSPFAMPAGVREAFRSLQVQLDQRDTPRKTVMLTSASRSDGKTSSALNLALALVAAGHRVILMDFDLRKPDAAARLGLPTALPGLAAMITAGAKLEDVLVQAPGLGPLQVLPAGAGAQEIALLDAMSRRANELLEEASRLADYVIVDTPPLGEVSDALRLALEVEHLVIIARPGNTSRRSFEAMRDLLGRNGRVPDGIVVVGQGVESGGYYGYGASAAKSGPSGRKRSSWLNIRSLLGD